MNRLYRYLFPLLSVFLLFQTCMAEDLTFENFIYTILDDGNIEIDRYTGDEEYLIIPEQIEDRPVISIGVSAFSHNERLKQVSIPESVTALGNYAFAECTNIQAILLPESLVSLGDLVFQGDVKLETITLPKGLAAIGINPFDRCDLISEITFSDNNPYYSSVDGVLFDRRNTVLTAYPTGKTDTEYTIPEWVTEIDFAAFSENKNLKEITLPDGLITIKGNPFCGCLGLTDIHISVFNRIFEMHSGALYNTHERELIAYLWSSDAESFTVQAGITSIGQEAFYKHTELKDIKLPKTLTRIGDAAFAECGLTSVKLPEGVISLGANTFIESHDLKKVILPSSLTWIGRYAFSECTSLESIVFPKSLDSIGEGAFYHCTALTELKLPENLRSIGDFAFLECSSLTSVEFQDHLYTIGRGAFYGLENLTAVVSPGSLAEKWAIQSEVKYTLKNVTYLDDQFI